MGFLKNLDRVKIHPLLNPEISKDGYLELDLSVSNEELQKVDVSSSDKLHRYIWDYLKDNNAQVAFGGYLEQRAIYRRSKHFNESNPLTERNIHLGIDLWLDAYEPIFAPLDGSIHSFRNNTNFGDYGPTLILKHTLEEKIFYTLYGHLSLNSLTDKKTGNSVRAGQQIGTLGSSEENGDYPPHLHFQIIYDLQGFEGDYPGVCSQLDVDFYKENCPDPNLLLRL